MIDVGAFTLFAGRVVTCDPARATPGDSALPASKQTRRFSGWLLGGYLPLIWQPADAHRST
jgi:hypothetical protein